MSKDRIAGDYYIIGNQLFKSEKANFEIENEDFQLYEVMRCINGRLIFEKDHLARLETGMQHLGYDGNFPLESVSGILKNLVEANDFRSGNVKIYTSVIKGKVKFAACYVPHNYPNDDLYRRGVELQSFKIERKDPTIKQISVSSKIQSALTDRIGTNYFETLLVDSLGGITEGSKSNFFLVKNGELYSALEENILPGITRYYVIEIAKRLNIPFHFQTIRLADIQDYQGAFICGTSPGVLPVSRIDSHNFNSQLPLIQKLIYEYGLILDAQAENK